MDKSLHEAVAARVVDDERRPHVRIRALLIGLGAGFVGTVLVLILALADLSDSSSLRRQILMGAAVPWAIFLSQLAVLISGVPFVTMARRWDSLTGFQRFVLGMAIIGCVVMLFAAVAGTLVQP